MKTYFKLITKLFLITSLTAVASLAFAASDISSLTANITKQANAIVSLLSITSYVSGVGFAMAGILQFKTHKENPQQTPLSKPVVMLLVSASLLFLPAILATIGTSLFGTNAKSAATAVNSPDLAGY